ncbi:MAG: CotH kinase family protein [Chitinophagaceae bacterium]
MNKCILVLLTLISSRFLLNGQVLLSSSNLPIIIIQMDNNQGIIDEPKRYGNMKLFYRGSGNTTFISDSATGSYLQYNGRIAIERRGSSSQWSSNLGKFSFGFETLKADSSNNNVVLLGMPKENDWILNAYVYDKTLIRNSLTAELSNRMGRKAQRSYPCEVILNGEYIGVYFLVEKIKRDKNRTDIEELFNTDITYPNLSGGYIYKIDKSSGSNNTNWTSVTGYSRYQYHYPNETNIVQAQKDFLKNRLDSLETVMNTNSTVWSQSNSGYPSFIDVQSFIDQHILQELGGNLDMLASSMYYSIDRGGKIVAGPIWDHDLAYGNNAGFDAWRTDVFFTNRGQSLADGPSYYQKWMFQDMNFRCQLAKRWMELRQIGGVLETSKIMAIIDSLATVMLPSNGREQLKYNTLGSNYFNSPSGWATRLTYQSEIDYMKNWLNNRLQWLDLNFPYAGTCNLDIAPTLTINEIMYHPIGDGATDSDIKYEYIELKNSGSQPIQLAGIFFSSGVSYKFPNYTLQPSEIIVLASDSSSFVTRYGFSPFGRYFRDLSNKSASIVLQSPLGTYIDSVTYADSYPWSIYADGFGRSLELKNSSFDNNVSSNWFVRNVNNGSPGLENNYIDSCSIQYPNLVINEIKSSDGYGNNSGDWVEIYNPNTYSVDISNWVVRDDNNMTTLSNTIVPALGYSIICGDSTAFQSIYDSTTPISPTQLGFGLNSSSDIIILESPNGCLIDFAKYFNTSPWPQNVSNSGSTIYLIHDTLDNNIGTSWIQSPNSGGSPGQNNLLTPPSAFFSSNIDSGNTVPIKYIFNATGSSDDQFISDYEWYINTNFIDTGIIFSHTFSTPGIYVIQLKTTDNDGLIDFYFDTLTIGTPPIAYFTASLYYTNPNISIDFNGISSQSLNSYPITNYSWNFGDNTPLVNGSNISHTYSTTGTYVATLTITDSIGLSSDFQRLIYVHPLLLDSIIPTEAVWQYKDDGTNQNSVYPQWKLSTSTIPTWNSGYAEFGYGDGDETTVVSYGGNASNKYTTTYFRKVFSVNNPSQYSDLTVHLKCDDGAVVYINGQEVARTNLPNGSIAYNTFALTPISGVDESTFNPFHITFNPLQNGNNIIAVEVHQSDLTSSDISFDLSLTASKSFNICDSISNEAIQINEIAYLDSTNLFSGNWLELYNNASTPLNINNWTLKSDSTFTIINSPTDFLPGQYIVLCSDSSIFKSAYPTVGNFLQSSSYLKLKPFESNLILLNSNGCKVDSVHYINSGPWPNLTSSKQSISLQIDSIQNEIASNWFLSNINQTTPGSINYNLPLPMNDVSFSVVLNSHQAIANWFIDNNTYTESILEYSVDGKLFSDLITCIKSITNSYSYAHANLKEGLNFYRIHIKNLDGNDVYSHIIPLRYEIQNDLLVFPNPTNDILIIRSDIQDILSATLYITNSIGEKISPRYHEVNKNEILLTTQGLPSGLYYLNIITNDNSYTVSFLKH